MRNCRTRCSTAPAPNTPPARVVHWSTAEVWQTGTFQAMASLEPEYYSPRQDARKHVELKDNGGDFYLRRQGRLTSFSVNGEEVFTDYRIFPNGGEPPNLGTLIGVGENSMGNGAAVEFTNLEIRKVGRNL
jgi:hypothetical protein